MKLKLSGKTDLVLSETKAALMEFSPVTPQPNKKRLKRLQGFSY